jgi:UDP-N-acetylglucosamine/UDP-N-acetylgalactosamine diphosphorylase
MTTDLATLRALAAEHGQDHILRWWDELGAGERAALLAQVAEIDFPLMDRLIQEHVVAKSATVLPADLQPVNPIPVPTTEAERAERQRAVAIGEEAIRAGRVAALVVAGGLGTRLGYDAPKGAFPAGSITGKPLFRLHAEKLLAAGRRYGAAIPWYVMTSEENDAQTRDYFAEQGYFGLRAEDVFFFRQGSMPAMGLDGKLLMASPGRLATSPNGHGGTLAALRASRALADLRRRGIQAISYFQVDNVLIRAIDPAFIGLHLATGSEFSSKSLPKRDPEEGLGV